MITESILEGRRRKASDQQIYEEIKRQNPSKASTFLEAEKRGANATAILEKIMEDNPLPQAQPEKSTINKIGDAIGGAGIGFAKGVMSLPQEAASLGQSIGLHAAAAVRPGVTYDQLKEAMLKDQSGTSKVAQGVKEGIAKTQRQFEPKNTAEKVGYGVEKAAEFLVPGVGEEKAAALAGKLASKVPEGVRGAQFVAKALPFAAKSVVAGANDAAKMALQTGGEDMKSVEQAGIMGAATPAALKVASKAVKLAGRAVGETLGITTGAGYGAIKQAFRDATPEFRAALRGNTEETTQNILTQSRDGLSEIVDDMHKKYISRMSKMKKAGKSVESIDDIKASADKLLENYGVTKGADGKFDFSRSTIADKTEQGRVSELMEGLNGWGNYKEDLQLQGLDTLKRRLDDFYSPSSQARAFVANLRSQVKKKITDVFPEYGTMTKDYADTLGLVKDIEQSLSLGKRAQIDTSIRKLTSVLRDNNDFRKKMLLKLEQSTGKNIQGQVAGAALSPWLPRSAVGRLLGGGEVGAGAAAGQILNPKFLFGLLSFSPRLVGEVTSALGLGTREAAKIAPELTKAFKGAMAQKIKAKNQ